MEVKERKGWSERKDVFGTSGNLEYPSSGCESRPAKAKTCDCGSLRITSEVTEHLLACGPEAADRASLG